MDHKEIIEKAIKEITSIPRYNFDVITESNIHPLTDANEKEFGYCVIFHLNQKYGYTEATINEWKNILGASDYYISASNNKLSIYFKKYIQ